jgi:glycosyltransferase involved in cell wall biosynthesis
MPRLFICTPTASLQGGVERILESLATHLPSRGFEVMFGLAHGARFHDPEAFLRAYPSMRGVFIDGTSGTMYGRRRALQRAIEENRPDIVLIARMFDAYPVCVNLKKRGMNLRLAVTVQAYEANYFVDLARYADFVDVCVTSGELIASAVRRFTSLPHDRVRSIPGGVRPVEQTLLSVEQTLVSAESPGKGVASQTGVSALQTGAVSQTGVSALHIGYVGRLEQVQKRVLDLPLLAAELQRRGIAFTLTIAGGGSAADELRRQLPQARHLGWLSTDELYARVYPKLDVLVHFAEWEGVTIAPREAMAHGVVPVISRFPGLETEGQFLDGENALTFPVGNIEAAADAIERLDRDRELLERLSRAARVSQQGIRSEQGAIDAWADAFRLALEHPPRIGTRVPQAPKDRGLLSILPAPIAEIARRIRGSQVTSAGGEWPHWSAMPDRELMQAVDDYARKRS